MPSATLLFPVLALALAACSGEPSKPSPTASATAATATATTTPSASATAPASAAPTALAAKGALVTREGQSLALEPDADALWVADEDHEVVRRVRLDDALRTPPKLANPPTVARLDARHDDVAMKGRPAQVLALGGGRVLASVRATASAKSGLVVALSTGDAPRELWSVEVPADAWGLAVSPDGKTAYVTSAWTRAVSAIDLAAHKVLWSIETAREPRAVVASADGKRLWITHLVGADLTVVDLGAGKPKADRIAFPADPLRLGVGEAVPASLGYAAILSPDGRRMFVARHALGSSGAWQGAPTVDVFSTTLGEAVARPRARPAFGTLTKQELEDNPWSMDSAGALLGGGARWVVPRAMAYRKKTDQLLVASEGGAVLAELDARSIAPGVVVNRYYELGGLPPTDPTTIQIAPDCGAATGVVLSRDETVAWVHCRTTDNLVAVRLTPNGARGVSRETEHAEGGRWLRTLSMWGAFAVARLAPPPTGEEAEALALGRLLFHDATEPVVSGGASCATCHPEGREDGHTWRDLKKYIFDKYSTFVSGPSVRPEREERKDGILYGMPRQTPMLAGRVDAQGPYGWHGESADVEARVRAGFGLHRWTEHQTDGKTLHRRGAPLALYVKKGLVLPPRAARELTAEETAGKEIFDSAQAKCATCHAPKTGFTDRSNVVVPLPTRKLFDDDPNKLFRVPSLLYVGETAPYYHDGSFATLEELIDGNKDRMGKTSHLDEAGRRALVAYLRTL